MDRFIEKQITEGALDSDGVFTLNPRLSYLRQDGAVLPEPQQWVLKLFQAISSMQTEKVQCFHGEDGLTVNLYGCLGLLESTLQTNLESGGLPNDPTHKALILALWEWLRQEGDAVLEHFQPGPPWALSITREKISKAQVSRQTSTGPSQRLSFHRQSKDLFAYQLESRLLFSALHLSKTHLEINDDPRYPFEPTPPLPSLGINSRRILVSMAGVRSHISQVKEAEIRWPVNLQRLSRPRFLHWFPNDSQPGDGERFDCLLTIGWSSQPEPSELCWLKDNVVVEQEKLDLPASQLKLLGFAPMPGDAQADITGLNFSDSPARRHLRIRWAQLAQQELSSLAVRDLEFPASGTKSVSKIRIGSAVAGALFGSVISPGFGTVGGLLLGVGFGLLTHERQIRRVLVDLFAIQQSVTEMAPLWNLTQPEHLFPNSLGHE